MFIKIQNDTRPLTGSKQESWLVTKGLEVDTGLSFHFTQRSLGLGENNAAWWVEYNAPKTYSYSISSICENEFFLVDKILKANILPKVLTSRSGHSELNAGGKEIRGNSNTPGNEQTKDQWKVICKTFVRKLISNKFNYLLSSSI